MERARVRTRAARTRIRVKRVRACITNLGACNWDRIIGSLGHWVIGPLGHWVKTRLRERTSIDFINLRRPEVLSPNISRTFL